MNISHLVHGIIIVMTIGNIKADVLHRNMEKIFVPIGSLLVDGKRTEVVLGNNLSPRTRIIIGKAVIGGFGHYMKHEHMDKVVWESVMTGKAPDAYFLDGIDFMTGKRIHPYTSAIHAVGYVGLNGTLRYLGIDEDYIDKKCDEYLPENVAWIVKPAVNIATDLAYDYVTVQLLKGIQQSIDKNR
jgi:hypothetical protein